MTDRFEEIKALMDTLEPARERMERIRAEKFSGYQAQLVAEQAYDRELEKVSKRLAPLIPDLIAELQRQRARAEKAEGEVERLRRVEEQAVDMVKLHDAGQPKEKVLEMWPALYSAVKASQRTES